MLKIFTDVLGAAVLGCKTLISTVFLPPSLWSGGITLTEEFTLTLLPYLLLLLISKSGNFAQS